MFHALELFLSGNYIATTSLPVIVAILFLAAVSESLGYSTVLYINRVPTERFIPSLSVNVLLYSSGVVFWVLSIWIMSRFIFSADITLVHLFRAIALAYVPQMLSFLVFIPLFGNAIRLGLNLVSFLLVIVFVQHCVQLMVWQTVLCVLLSFLILELLQHKVANPVREFASSLRNLAAGKEILVTKQELEPFFNTQLRKIYLKASAKTNQMSTTLSKLPENWEMR